MLQELINHRRTQVSTQVSKVSHVRRARWWCCRSCMLLHTCPAAADALPVACITPVAHKLQLKPCIARFVHCFMTKYIINLGSLLKLFSFRRPSDGLPMLVILEIMLIRHWRRHEPIQVLKILPKCTKRRHFHTEN